jgi:hypothetical protein
MSHGSFSNHAPADPASAGPALFSPAEIDTFRADDRSAATAIVGLMAGIFSIGLIGYLLVCYWVSS